MLGQEVGGTTAITPQLVPSPQMFWLQQQYAVYAGALFGLQNTPESYVHKSVQIE